MHDRDCFGFVCRSSASLRSFLNGFGCFDRYFLLAGDELAHALRMMFARIVDDPAYFYNDSAP